MGDDDHDLVSDVSVVDGGVDEEAPNETTDEKDCVEDELYCVLNVERPGKTCSVDANDCEQKSNPGSEVYDREDVSGIKSVNSLLLRKVFRWVFSIEFGVRTYPPALEEEVVPEEVQRDKPSRKSNVSEGTGSLLETSEDPENQVHNTSDCWHDPKPCPLSRCTVDFFRELYAFIIAFLSFLLHIFACVLLNS